MTSPSHPYTIHARARQRAAAKAIGIDEAYIDRLVETFYGKVRTHPVLGPIFNGIIGETWGPHLRIMKDFWESIALAAASYHGRPVPVHQEIADKFAPQHFPIWLGLFRQTLEETAPTPAAVLYFMERAERIAASLTIAVFERPKDGGVPALDLPEVMQAQAQDRGVTL